MKKNINKSFSSLFSTKRRSSACLLAAISAASFEAKAVNFAGYGNAPQAILFSGTVTGTNLLNLTNADPSNFTLASTASASHTALFALSATSATTLSMNSNLITSPAHWSAITWGTSSSTTTLASSTTGTSTYYSTDSTFSATLAYLAADQLSGSVIQNFSAAQLAGLLNAGLNNPASYRAFPPVLSTAGTAALTKLTNSNYIAMIPKYVRTGVMSNTWSTTLTNAGWVE